MLLEPIMATVIGVLMKEAPIPGTTQFCLLTEQYLMPTLVLPCILCCTAFPTPFHIAGVRTYVGMAGALMGLALVSVGSVRRQNQEARKAGGRQVDRHVG